MRKTWIWVALAVILLAGLVTGQLLMTRHDKDASESSSAKSQGSYRAESNAPTIPPLPEYQRELSRIAPRGPLKAGDPLPPLAASPAGLVSGFAKSAAPAGSAFEIIFRPWGMGPVSPMGRTIVATVYSAQGAGPNSLLAKRTVLLIMDSRRGGTVTQGGTYRGTVTFTQTSTGAVPVLSKVESNSP